jgi:hypothetical protein
MSNTLNVTDMSYCENTRNIDNMLSQFQKDRKYIVSLIDTDIDRLIVELWSPMSPVCFDNKCLFNMGRTLQQMSLGERVSGNIVVNEGVVNFYTCPQCKNMKRLVDFTETRIGEPFYIECGCSAGQQLIVTETNICKLFVLKESPPPTVARALKNPYITDLNRCSAGCNTEVCSVKNYGTMDYIGSDAYTNNVLINWYLNQKLSEMNIPNVITMHIGFVCSGKGYSLYEYPDIGRLRHLQEHPEYLGQNGQPSPTAKADDKVPISKDTVKGIIMQLFGVLHALKSYDFSHGGPSSRSILFKKEICSYLYDGVHVEGPITLKLCDLNHAGITVCNKRFYNKSVIADEEMLKKPFRPIIDTVSITPFSFNRNNADQTVTIYRLKDPNQYLQEAMLFMYIKHLGLPIYQSSFDVYGFMISLMADRAFYITVMSDESMYSLWRSMWMPDEFELVQDKIQKIHKYPDPMTRVDKVLRFLAGFGLRCDMIDHGWNRIKMW